MLKYVLKRLLWMVLVVIGVMLIIFTLMYVVPGDPAEIVAGSTATDDMIEATRERLGLSDPYLVQLWRYVKGVIFHLDFGTSYLTEKSVSTELAVRLPRTILLGCFSLFLSVSLGVIIGVVSAVHRNGIGDRISMIVALIGVSVPQFWLALLLVILFSVKLGWLPATGISSLSCYIMPCIALAVSGVGGIARQSRSSMLEVIRADYVTTARAKGMKERDVIYKHALPNALLPIITLAGNNLAHVFGGAVAIETVFAIPGVGYYMVSAINKRDYPVIRGSVIVLAIAFSLVMLLVDLMYAAVDPRIRSQYKNKK